MGEGAGEQGVGVVAGLGHQTLAAQRGFQNAGRPVGGEQQTGVGVGRKGLGASRRQGGGGVGDGGGVGGGRGRLGDDGCG